MWNNVLGLILLPSAFLLGSRWGIAGVAAGWAVAHPVILLQFYRKVAQRIELKASDYFGSLVPAVTGVLAMAIAVLAVSHAASGLHPAVRLTLQVAVGALVYVATIYTLFRDRFERTLRILRHNAGTDGSGTPDSSGQRASAAEEPQDDSAGASVGMGSSEGAPVTAPRSRDRS
jgi:multidrug transporter EmrE-like cation transporter